MSKATVHSRALLIFGVLVVVALLRSLFRFTFPSRPHDATPGIVQQDLPAPVSANGGAQSCGPLTVMRKFVVELWEWIFEFLKEVVLPLFFNALWEQILGNN
ncbi:hypothetical protein BDZ89DRAFT_1140006 [Hymenopellis radicata]|nr:hypothetical protein BDZ89DRAFT_1140006 [Hymenopellis radicata]